MRGSSDAAWYLAHDFFKAQSTLPEHDAWVDTAGTVVSAGKSEPNDTCLPSNRASIVPHMRASPIIAYQNDVDLCCRSARTVNIEAFRRIERHDLTKNQFPLHLNAAAQVKRSVRSRERSGRTVIRTVVFNRGDLRAATRSPPPRQRVALSKHAFTCAFGRICR